MFFNIDYGTFPFQAQIKVLRRERNIFYWLVNKPFLFLGKRNIMKQCCKTGNNNSSNALSRRLNYILYGVLLIILLGALFLQLK